MPRTPRRSRSLVIALLPALVIVSLSAPAWAARRPVEPYATYVAADHCSPRVKPGTELVARWIVATYGGGRGPLSRGCTSHRDVSSEHQEGRAFDWTVSARRPADRKRVARLFHDLLAPDAAGHQAALARRMGVMYLIWNDHLYGAWNHFAPEPYLSSSCPSVKRCSDNLRHRTHVHVSLSRAGGFGLTSWYDGRLDR